MRKAGCLLRGYQVDMVRHVLDCWMRHDSVLVQMPTGTGKTAVLASLVNEQLKMKNEKSGCRVWIVAHRRELVEQIEETVARYGVRKETGIVKVLSIQWLSRHWEDMKDEKPSLIVIDEAHHALANTYKELWTRYLEAKKLGMTATPCRLNGMGFTDLFDMLVTSDSIANFIRQGWLSAFDYVSIRPDGKDQMLVDSLQKRGADGDYQIKEMNTVLNKRPSIERLYESVRQYADGKKGIVYAISIDHAKNIAGYYKEHGVNAVAIDSKTPANLRKQLVEDFKQGKIQVLVNVDVFSEGFDCPDVEFVQMARPTLSLAKYLQQVGRGLRKVEGKESCMLIDNVGLYRLFGLPMADRDWQAMFEGRLAGKGNINAARTEYSCAVRDEGTDDALRQDDTLEVVMTHDRLFECLNNDGGFRIPTVQGALRAFKDRTSGLYGLKRGDKITALPQYTEVSGTDDDLAAVRFKDGHIGVVDENGDLKIRLDRYKAAKFLKDNVLAVSDNHGREAYIDLLNCVTYPHKPKVLNFGQVQILEVDGISYSRTRILYKEKLYSGDKSLFNYGFYLRICDYFSSPKCRQVNEEDTLWGHDNVCLLADDFETYYHYCGLLADGSIVIADTEGRYYHVEEGKGKQYVAREHPETKDEDFGVAISRLMAEAKRKAEERKEEERQTDERKRWERLAEIRNAVPFKSGLKWGLKSGDKIIVPPIYRNMKNPVGCYCAVESNPNQWGIIMLDGTIVVEIRYANVEIENNGIARLTVIPGKVKTIRLHNLDSLS